MPRPSPSFATASRARGDPLERGPVVRTAGSLMRFAVLCENVRSRKMPKNVHIIPTPEETWAVLPGGQGPGAAVGFGPWLLSFIDFKMLQYAGLRVRR